MFSLYFQLVSVPSNGDEDRILSEGDTINTQTVLENIKEERQHEYDIVIIATPLTSDKSIIKFVNFTDEFEVPMFDGFTEPFDFPGHYQRIVCTMVDGRLKPSSLKIPKGLHLDEILTTNPRLAYNAIGKQHPVSYDNDCSNEDYSGVWKIFSPRPFTEEQLKTVFRVRKSTTVIDWLAYPHYKSNQDLGKFTLGPGLLYLNAIEKAGSAMEMSSIGAKNVALLAYKYWKKDENAGKTIIREEL